MKKLQNYIPLSLLVAGAFATQTGCVDAADSLRILNNQAPGANCVLSATKTGTFVSFGRIDVAATSGYLFSPIVENRTTGDQTTDRKAFVSGAIVTLKFADDFSDLESGDLASFRQPFSGSIDSGSTTSFGFEVISTELLQEMAGRLGAGEVTRVFAEVEIQAEIDGSGVSTPVFTYPIEVSNGLLYENLGSCDALPDIEFEVGGTCQPLQDGFAHCCDDSGTLVCSGLQPAPEPVE